MFDQITDKLTGISNRLRGRAHLTESNVDEVLREIRIALLEADVALPVARDFIARVKASALGRDVLKSLSPSQMFIGIIHEELIKTLSGDNGDADKGFRLNVAAPAVILMAGLQGVGKTTTCAKLALWLRKHQKKKVLITSGDVYRPAAMTQLKTLAGQVEVDYFERPATDRPVDIAKAALIEAKNRLYDVLIVDTAGRLSVDEAMMTELSGIHQAIHPHETFLVVDAMQGQDALNTAKAFSERVKITGLVLTKADGDSRGGAVLSAQAITGAPVRFAGVSEKMEGLELFDARRMADRIIGMGDIVGLFEQASAQIDEAQARKMAQKLTKGKGLDLMDFRAQIEQMRKMGGLETLLEKMPANIRQMAAKAPQQMGDKEMAHMQGIIDAMTPKERANPDLLKASRKRRIAAGAGVQVQEVNKLLNSFEQMQKMGKKLKDLGGLGNLGQLMGGMGGGMPSMGGLAQLGKKFMR